MVTEQHNVTDNRRTNTRIEATISGIKRMLIVGGLFVAVGYLLVLGALAIEFLEFHPLIDEFFGTHTEYSIAGGGPDRTGDAGLNEALTSIHQFPSLLLWMKLGGIAHVLVGIFIALAGIVRALGVMPHRLAERIEAGAD